MMNEQLTAFLQKIEDCTYGQKFIQWEQYLQQKSESDHYHDLLGLFLKCFPFNFHYWYEYIQHANTKIREYQSALTCNPKCYQLWVLYLQEVREALRDEPEKYKKQLEAAIVEIGADSRALWLYEEYYEMVNENGKYQFYKKIFTRALVGLETMYDKFVSWFSSLKNEQINGLAIKQYKYKTALLSFEQQKTNLRQLINSTYYKTISYREMRLKLQGEIQHYYYDGSETIKKERKIWRDLITLERQNGIVENISYCYERSLMAQTDDIELWEEVFHYMENQTNKYQKVMSILRNNKTFFIKFNKSLYFYWCDLQERQTGGVAVARQMYEQLVKIYSTYEVYERWIQLQIREKKVGNAKAIFDNMLIVFQKDIDMLCYVVVEYSQFIVKHYKEYDLAKNFLKSYIDHLPFNHYLFTKYLQFMKNFENKEGFYEELMKFIAEALAKARKALQDQQFTGLTKIIKFYLRSTLGSIYLIKISEHKMLEVEQKLAKSS